MFINSSFVTSVTQQTSRYSASPRTASRRSAFRHPRLLRYRGACPLIPSHPAPPYAMPDRTHPHSILPPRLELSTQTLAVVSRQRPAAEFPPPNFRPCPRRPADYSSSLRLCGTIATDHIVRTDSRVPTMRAADRSRRRAWNAVMYTWRRTL